MPDPDANTVTVSTTTGPRSRSGRILATMLAGLVIAATVVVLAAAVVALPFGTAWIAMLFSQFLPHLLVAALVLLIASTLIGSRAGLILAALAALVATGQLGMLAATASARQAPGTPDLSFRAITFNITMSNVANATAIVRFVERESPDVLVLQEYSRPFDETLREPLLSSLPEWIRCGDVLIMSHWPLTDRRTMRDEPCWGEFSAGGIPLTVIGVHLAHPFSGPYTVNADEPDPGMLERTRRRAERQLRQFETLDAFLAARDGPVLLAGDLNAAPWSIAMRRLIRRHGLTVPAPWALTWPARFPLLQIDAILARAPMARVAERVGHAFGSDHRPVVATIDLSARR